MKGPSKLLAVIVVALLLSAAFSWWNRRSAGPEAVQWRKDYAAAKAESNQASKPMVVYFTAAWCPPCQWMSQNTWTDPRVGAAMKDYVPVKVDVDANRSVARQYGVSSIPRILVVGTDGNIQRDETGSMSAEQFVDWLKR